MTNEDGTIWTVFNGEIYNHRQLRRDLASRGHLFKGHSDTEVLPHLYEEEGPNCVTRLRGMFALAIYDNRSQSLLLARDRFGIKPLFYAPGKERLIFASEIRALLQVPDIDSEPDRQAIVDFAALFYIPAPETFYRGIRALEPGQMLEARLENNRLSWKTRVYHRWVLTPNPELTLVHATEQAQSLIEAAVARQIESDVPLGAFLSGGIDSSLVSAAAQTAVGGKLQTFNVRFSDEAYDETWAAVQTASHIGSYHQTLDMDDVPGTWEHITDLLLYAGQPYADTSVFAANAICKLMRRHVTVALSGDGGDEAFGGYDIYWQIARIARWQLLPRPLWHGAMISSAPLAFFGCIPEHWPQRMRELYAADETAVIQSLFSWISEEEHKQLCRDTDLLPPRRLFERCWDYGLPRKTSRLEHLCAHATEVNTRLTLANDFLFKVDLASMKESLEVRVPMLDEDLFTFALSLPHELKVHGRTCKRILRAIAQRRLPMEVAIKPKWGFGVPVDQWVDGEFRENLREYLLGPSSKLPEYFWPETYRPWVEAFCDGRLRPGLSRSALYERMIMFLSFQLAMEQK